VKQCENIGTTNETGSGKGLLLAMINAQRRIENLPQGEESAKDKKG